MGDFRKTVIVLRPRIQKSAFNNSKAKLPPKGHRAEGLRPKGGNLRPKGNLIWPMGGNFSGIPRGRRCRISNTIMVRPILPVWGSHVGHLGAMLAMGEPCQLKKN